MNIDDKMESLFKEALHNVITVNVTLKNVVLFRSHSGALSDSMVTVMQFVTKEQLLEWVRKIYPMVTIEDIDIRDYCFDDRTGWDTKIVTSNDGGVLGFTNGYFDVE